HRIVRGDAHVPTLHTHGEIRLAGKRQSDGHEVQTAQHAEFKSQPAIGKLQHRVHKSSSESKTFTTAGSNSMAAPSASSRRASSSLNAGRNGRASVSAAYESAT